MKKIYVCCPGDSVTGGPELLHQLVDVLRLMGKDASIIYYPFNKVFQVPDQYKKYNIAVTMKGDCNNGTVVLPEERTAFVDLFIGYEIYIWWLSVDSYFGKSSKHNGRSYFKYVKRLASGRSKSLSALKKYRHMVQSEYARLFLQRKGIDSVPLSDYLNEAHFNGSSYKLSNRKNQILYNPKKGYQVTSKLIKKFHEIKFIPLQNMSSSEVASALRESKIYIDFGSHPGKDRFPREAVMAGCCVITGRRGSAVNKQDIAILEKYKLNEKSIFLLNRFDKITSEVFNNYSESFKDFDIYRQRVSQERTLFQEQAMAIFKHL